MKLKARISFVNKMFIQFHVNTIWEMHMLIRICVHSHNQIRVVRLSNKEWCYIHVWKAVSLFFWKGNIPKRIKCHDQTFFFGNPFEYLKKVFKVIVHRNMKILSCTHSMSFQTCMTFFCITQNMIFWRIFGSSVPFNFFSQCNGCQWEQKPFSNYCSSMFYQ